MSELPPKSKNLAALNIEEKIAYLEDAINIQEKKMMEGAKLEETKTEIRKLQKEKVENEAELQKIKEKLKV